jgi:hypothetical protein
MGGSWGKMGKRKSESGKRKEPQIGFRLSALRFSGFVHLFTFRDDTVKACAKDFQ